MNQKLVELANRAGFKSAMFTDTKWEHSSKEDLRWYLWVCELRRWFMREHKLFIEVFHIYDSKAPSYTYMIKEVDETNRNDEVIIETALLSIFSVDKDLLLKRGINLNL